MKFAFQIFSDDFAVVTMDADWLLPSVCLFMFVVLHESKGSTLVRHKGRLACESHSNWCAHVGMESTNAELTGNWR